MGVSPHRLRRALGHGMLFVAAFAAVSAVVAWRAGVPKLGTLGEKLLYFKTHKDAYDVVFVGSSRVERGVVPPLFDAEMARHGHALTSFNFGAAGMEAHEANALVRRLIAMRPARLRYVVVELDGWDPVLETRNRFKRRVVFWHDAAETRSVLRSTAHLDAPLAARADLAATHLLHFAARSLAVGRGPDAVRPLRVAAVDLDEMARWRGFRPYAEGSYRHNPLRRRFLLRLDDYRAAVRRVEREHVGAATEGDVAAVRDQVAMIRGAGLEPVHLVPPVPRVVPALAGHVPILLAFNRPGEYAELFTVERRFDREHLTQEGAESFTRLLARRFAAEVVGRRSTRFAALER